MVVGLKKRRVDDAAAARRTLLLRALILLLGVAVGSGTALANPKGATVVSGGISISMPSPTTVDVNQSTNNGIIDWQSFNIATGEKTVFQVPTSSSTTLNRVNVGNPSSIAGTLTSNGNLILVNPSGIVFTNGAQVDANSLLATTTDISNKNFLNGNMRFDIPSPNPNAGIVNAGHITVGQSGLAALVAPSVANSGVIAAKLGKVTIAGAESYTIDFYGDGLINFDVGPSVTQAPTGVSGSSGGGLVSNTGKIIAPGGTVLLTADAAAGLLANVIQAGGTIAAPTTAQGTGSVTINAGANGALVTGAINVAGAKAGRKGGKAVVTGNTVSLAPSAKINASGNAGGGTVEIGGGPHGTDPTVANAAYTTVATGATIDASATGNGNGGTVSVWSNDGTAFGGTILAQGGALGGNGGWVETSGHLGLVIADSATINTLAPHGQTGTWLIDPVDLTIESGTATDGAVTIGATFQATNVDSANIQDTDITTQLGSTDVTVTTACGGGACNGPLNGTITVATGSNLSWATGKSLTLHADNDIVIQSGVTIDGSNASSALNLSAGNTTATGGISTASAITVGSLTATTNGGGLTVGGNVTTGTGTISLNSGAGLLTLTNSLFSTGQITLTADSMTFGGQIGGSGAGAGVASQATLAPSTAGTQIDVTTGAGTGLVLSPTDLQNDVRATTLQLGNTNTSQVSIASALNFSGTHVTNLTVDPGFIDLNANVTTAGGQQYSDAVVLGADVTLTSTAGGNIRFGSTVDSGTAAGTFGLTASTNGGGTVLFGGNVGTTTSGTTGAAGALKSLDVTAGSGGITVDGDVQTSTATGTGNQNYNSALVLGGGGTQTFTTGGGAITFSSTVDDGTLGQEGMSINAGTGTVTFGGAVGTTALASLADTAGTTALNGGPVTTTGTINLTGSSGGITLGTASTTLTTTNSLITLGNQVSGSGETLTLTSGTGGATLNGVNVGTTGSLAFTGTTAALTLDGGTYTIGSSFSFPSIATTMSGTLVLGDTGTTTFNGVTTLAGNTTVDSSGAGGNITFGNTVDATSSGGQSLTVNAGAGTASLNGAVGFTTPLSSVSVTSSAINVNATIATNGSGQSYTGPVTLTNAVDFNDTGGGNIDFTSTVDGAHNLGINTTGGSVGTVTFGGAVGATTPPTLFTVTGATTLDGNVSTNGNQTYNNAVTLNAATVTLNSNASGASNGTIDLAKQTTTNGGAADTLALTSGTGNETISGFTTAGAGNLTFATTGTITLDAGTYTIGSSYAFPAATANGNLVLGDTGTTTFGALTLGSATQFLSDTTDGGANGNITFGTINGGNTLTINAGTGVATLGGVIGGGAPVTSVTVTSDPDINASVTTASGGQTYNGPISLGGNIVLTDNGGGALVLNGQVTGGGNSLTLSTSGAETLAGVTTTSTLTLGTPSSLTLNAGVYSIGNGITTYTFPTVATTLDTAAAGTLTLGQPTTIGGTISLGNDTVLSAGTNAIDLNGQVTGGAKSLTLTTSGDETLSGVTTTSTLTLGTPSSLTLDAGTYTIGSGTYTFPSVSTNVNGGTLTFGQSTTFSGAVTVTSPSTVDSSAANGTLIFSSTVNGGNSLIVTSGSGNVTFDGAVGGTTPLTDFEVTSTGTVSLGAGVATVDIQGYTTGTLNLTGGASYKTQGGASGRFSETGAVVLNGTGTVTVDTTNGGGSPAGGAIQFGSGATNGTINGALPLVLTAGTSGDVRLNSQVGGTLALTSLTASGATIQLSGVIAGSLSVTPTTTLELSGNGTTTGTFKINGGVGTLTFPAVATTTNGTLTFDNPTTFAGAVTLGGVTTLNATSLTIIFDSTVDAGTAGVQSLTVGDGTGTVTFDGNVGTTSGALGGLSVTGGTITLGGNVSTSFTQSYTPSTDLVLTAGDSYLTNISGASTGATFVVSGPTQLAGTGTVTVDTTNSGGFTSGANVTFGTIDAASAGQVGLSITAGTGGIVTLGGAIGTTALASLSVTGATHLNAGTVTTTGAQTYNSAVTLGAGTILTSTNPGVGTDEITFGNTVNGAFTLEVSDAGTTSINGVVGGTTALISLTIDTGGQTNIAGGAITTLGGQTYNDGVDLLGATTFASTGGGDIKFVASLLGGNTLIVNTAGTTTFGGSVNEDSVTTDAAGATAINGGSVTTAGNQTYNDPVTLGADTTLTSTGGGTIALNGQVTAGAHSLTFSTTAAETLFGFTTTAVNGLVLGTPSSLTLDAGTYSIGNGTATYSFPSVPTTLNGGTLTLSQPTTFNGAVTLATGTTTLDSHAANGAIDFTSTIDGGFGLIVNAGTGVVTFGAAVGHTTPLTSLSVTDPVIDADVTTTAGQTYSDPVTLGNTVTLSSTGGGAIDFASMIDATTGGVQGLTVSTTGTVTYGGIVGGGAALASLSTTGGVIDINTTAITTAGTQGYTGPITLGATTTLTSTGTGAAGNITFNSGTTINGAFGLTVATAGTAAFDSAVGATTALTSVDVSNTSGSTTLGANVTTAGPQTYAGTTTLTASEVTLNSNSGAANGAIDFGGQVTGSGDSLTLTSGAGSQTLAGVNLGATRPLTLTTTGLLTLNAGTYTFSDGTTAFPAIATTLDGAGAGTLTLGQSTTFNGALTLANNATVDGSAANAAIVFASTVNGTASGSQGLTVTAGTTTGTVAFDAAVGGTTPLSTFSVTAGGTAGTAGLILNGGVATSGGSSAQSYLDTVGNIKFGSGAGDTYATNGGTFTVNSGQTIGTESVALGGTTETIDTSGGSGGTITITSNINSSTGTNHALSLVSGGGAITIGGAIGGGLPLNTVTMNSGNATITLDRLVETGGAQSYTDGTLALAGSVYQTNAATFTQTGSITRLFGGNANIVIDTTGGIGTPTAAGANISITNGSGGGNLNDATAGAHQLVLSAGTGNITLSAAGLGGALGGVRATGAGITLLGGVNTTGAQSYTDTTLALDGNVYQTNFTGTASSTASITVSGTITLGNSTVTLDTTGFGNGPAGAGITMNSAATIDGADTLMLTAGTGGTISLNAIGQTTPLTGLDVASALSTTLNGNVTTSGGQTYDSPVTVASTTSLIKGGTTIVFDNAVTLQGTLGITSTGGSVLFNTTNSTIDGDFALTVTSQNPSVFKGVVGGTTPLASLTVTDPTLDANVTTVGAQTYNDAVTLGNTIILTTTNSPVTFGTTLDATTLGAQGLTVSAGTGTVTFDGVIGGMNPLASLTVTGGFIIAGGSTTVTGPATFTGRLALNAPTYTLGSFTENGATTVGANATIDTSSDTGAIMFQTAGTIDDTAAGTHTLTLNAGTGTVTVAGAVGGTAALKSLTTTGPTTLDANVSTEGGQTYNSALSLGSTLTLNSNANGTGNGAIDIAGTVDATTAGAQGLTLTAGTGTITIGGAAGGSKSLASLSATTTGTVNLDGSVTTVGAQSYTDTTLDLNGASYTTTGAGGTFTETGATVITANATVDTSAQNQNIIFQTAGTIDDQTAGTHTLTLKAGTGTITIHGAVGGSAALAGLTANATGGTVILDGSVTTTGAQSYSDTTLDLNGTSYRTTGAGGTFTETGATTLTSNVTVNTSAQNQAIAFQTAGTIDAQTNGGQWLVLNAGTGVVTAGAIGSSMPLAALTVEGGTPSLAAIDTVGNIILKATAGNLALSAAVNANDGLTSLGSTPGQVGLWAVSGNVSQSGSGIILASAVEALAGGSVNLPLANRIGASDTAGVAGTTGTVAGASGGAFALDDSNAPLTVGSLTVSTEANGGFALGNQAGVVTSGGDILLQTTNTGNLTLANNVCAGVSAASCASSMGANNAALVSASGSIAETNGLVSATALLANAKAASQTIKLQNANEVGTLAGQSGGEFEFVNTPSLTIGTTPVINGTTAQSNVTTTAGDVRIIAGGALTLATNVSAGNGANNAALVANGGSLTETAGFILANGLIANASGAVVLDSANGVSTLTGQAGGGNFQFTNASGLTVGSVPLVGDNDAHAVGAQSNVVTLAGAGDIRIVTQTNNLLLASNVCAGLSSAACTAGMSMGSKNAALVATAGSISETTGLVSAADLVVNAEAANQTVKLDQANQVGTLVGQSGSTFQYTNAVALNVGTAPAIADVASQSNVDTGTGDVRIITQTGNLNLADNVCAGLSAAACTGGTTMGVNNVALVATAGSIAETTGLVSATDLVVNAEAANQTVKLQSANEVGTLAGQSGGEFEYLNAVGLTVGTTPLIVDVASQSNVATTAGDIRIVLNTGSLTVASDVCAGISAANCANSIGANNVGLVATTGSLTETTGVVSANALVTNAKAAGQTVTFDNANHVGTLVGQSGSTYRYTNAVGLTVGSIAQIGDNDAHAINQANVATTAGDIRIQTSTGNLTLASDVCAGSVGCGAVGTNNAALVTPRNLTQTGGLVSANNLIANAGGSITLDDSSPTGANNLVDTLTAKAASGIAFGNATNLTLAAVPTIIDVAGESGLVSTSGAILVNVASLLTINNVGLTTAGDILVTAGSITTTGAVPLTSGSENNIILASGGAFDQQSGSITISGPVLVIDTTGAGGGAASFNTNYKQPSQINLVAAHQGGAKGDITLNGSLSADGSLVFLSSNGGAITGSSVTVNALGVSNTGSGGSAALNGSIEGNSTQTAAETGQPFTTASNNYRFNGCAIGSVSCTVLPALTPVQPAPITNFAVFVAAPTEDDVDAPLTNIFDEDRLCDELYQSAPDVARQVCQ